MAKPRSEYRKLLERAINTEAKRRKKTLLQHAVSLAYKDVTVLNTILRKVLPDLRSIDAKITSGGPFRLIIEVAERDQLPKDDKPESTSLEYAKTKGQQALAQAEADRYQKNYQLGTPTVEVANRFKMNKRKTKRKSKHTNKKE